VLYAHGMGVDALRANGVKNVGIVTNLEKAEAASVSEDDQKALEIGDALFNGWFLGGIYKGQYPKVLTDLLAPYLPKDWQKDMEVVNRPLDWAGINYYSRGLYTMDKDPAHYALPIKQVKGTLETNDLGWEIYPKGLTDLLVRVSRDYTKLPLYITETGMSETNDERRVAFYDAHLNAVLEAQKQGADVRGFFAWSLLDNYEWGEGYSSRFGIVHVDYATQTRTPKGSYRAFQGMLHNTR
jgi:beta-glucosidase